MGKALQLHSLSTPAQLAGRGVEQVREEFEGALEGEQGQEIGVGCMCLSERYCGMNWEL